MCSRGILKIPNIVFSQEITLEMELNCIDFLCSCRTIVVIYLFPTLNDPWYHPPNSTIKPVFYQFSGIIPGQPRCPEVRTWWGNRGRGRASSCCTSRTRASWSRPAETCQHHRPTNLWEAVPRTSEEQAEVHWKWKKKIHKQFVKREVN